MSIISMIIFERKLHVTRELCDIFAAWLTLKADIKSKSLMTLLLVSSLIYFQICLKCKSFTKLYGDDPVKYFTKFLLVIV